MAIAVPCQGCGQRIVLRHQSVRGRRQCPLCQGALKLPFHVMDRLRDRRQDKRLSGLGSQVKWTPYSWGITRPQESLLSDLSWDGACMRTDKAPRKAVIHLKGFKVLAPNQESMMSLTFKRLRAIVTWTQNHVNDHLWGLRFVDASSEDKAQLVWALSVLKS